MSETAEPLTPRERVIAEKRRRGWSARTAGIAAGISNTTWSKFERNGEVTDVIRQAVADAFGWPIDWPEGPVLAEPDIQQAILDKLDEVLAELRAHREQVEPDSGVDAVLERLVKAVEAAVARRLPPGQQPSTPEGSQAG